jgi:hypothetical protein
MESRGAIHAEQVATVVISVVSGTASGLLGEDACLSPVRRPGREGLIMLMPVPFGRY